MRTLIDRPAPIVAVVIGTAAPVVGFVKIKVVRTRETPFTLTAAGLHTRTIAAAVESLYSMTAVPFAPTDCAATLKSTCEVAAAFTPAPLVKSTPAATCGVFAKAFDAPVTFDASEPVEVPVAESAM